MILDKQNMFCSAQAVTASAASADYIDLSQPRDAGFFADLNCFIACSVAAAAAGAATVQFQLQCSVDAAFTSPVIVGQTDLIPKASLTAGFSTYIPLAIGSQYRYMRLYFNVGTGPLTAGTFTAGITPSVQKATIYPIAPNA